MDTIDNGMAARVWQRVNANAEPSPAGLTELIANEQTAAAAYGMLLRHMQGNAVQALRKLREQALANADCLRGICTLTLGETPRVGIPTQTFSDPSQTLCRCYSRALHSISQYEQKTNDPQYGHVFAFLARQSRESCPLILMLIGSLKK